MSIHTSDTLIVQPFSGAATLIQMTISEALKNTCSATRYSTN